MLPEGSLVTNSLQSLQSLPTSDDGTMITAPEGSMIATDGSIIAADGTILAPPGSEQCKFSIDLTRLQHERNQAETAGRGRQVQWGRRRPDMAKMSLLPRSTLTGSKTPVGRLREAPH